MNADINTGLITVTTYAGCVTFMSNSIHNKKVRGAITLPKIIYVLSMVCTKEYNEYIKSLWFKKDVKNYISIIVSAIEIMEKNK